LSRRTLTIGNSAALLVVHTPLGDVVKTPSCSWHGACCAVSMRKFPTVTLLTLAGCLPWVGNNNNNGSDGNLQFNPFPGTAAVGEKIPVRLRWRALA
jgi:hypothetical protein